MECFVLQVILIPYERGDPLRAQEPEGVGHEQEQSLSTSRMMIQRNRTANALMNPTTMMTTSD